MAGTGYKLFVNGNTLSASDLNTYLNQQTVMVFSSTAARTSALSGVVAEGMVSYVTGTGLQYYTGSAWANFDHTFSGSSSGSTLLQASATASGTLTLPAATDTLVGQTTSDTLINKTLTNPIINQTVNNQTGTSYTFVLSDAGKYVTGSNAASQTYYIPTNASVAFPVGCGIDLIAIGAGQITVTATTSGTTTIYSTGATAASPKLRVQYSAATLKKVATDTWHIIGDLA